MNVLLEDGSESGKTATVIVPDRQLSLAIGKEGQNARLAAKLTGWRIDIKSATEAAEETLGRLEDIDLPPDEMDLLSLAESLLRKKPEAGLTDDEKQLVEVAVAERDLESPVPAGETPEAEAEKVEAVAEEEKVVSDELLEEIEDGELEAEPVEDLEREPVLAAAGEEAEALAPDGIRPGMDILLEEVEEEQLPVLEGEPASDSLGWVQVVPEVDYYSGWSDEEDAEEEVDLEREWAREDLEARRETRKKKGKRRRRSEPDFFDNGEADADGWMGRR
jgi:hypothetical protein